MDAITYDPQIKQTLSLEGFKKKTKKMTPAEKRYEYAMQSSQTLRDDWLKNRSK
jgi:hypothetical protein